jgi:hypothetical protein
MGCGGGGNRWGYRDLTPWIIRMPEEKKPNPLILEKDVAAPAPVPSPAPEPTSN